MADQYAQDGQIDFLGGQNASTIPYKVAENALYAAVNTSFTNGIPQPRWSLNRRTLTFPEGGVTNPISKTTVPYKEVFEGGRFQSFIPYAFGGTDYIVTVISGVIFLVNRGTFQVSVIDIQGGGSLNQTTPRLNWSAAGNFLVIFDYPNYPVIFDGITAHRADPALYEVPISVNGTFNQSRLFISNAGNEYTAGDPVGNPATPDAPVTFEEVLAPAATYINQVFQLPTNYQNNTSDPITAMTFLQQTDSSTGIGPLLVATKNQIFSVQAQLPRSQWQPSGQPSNFASVFVNNAGIAGPRAFVNVNSDVFFLSNDGQVRSAAMSRDEQHKWARVPISREVQNWLIYHDPSLISYSSMGYFNNKIFATVNPYRVEAQDTDRNPIYDVAFGGMISLGTDNLAVLNHDGTPAWDGLWTGCRPMDFCTINNQFFVIAKDEESVNAIYEYDPYSTFDTSGSNIRQIKSVLYTREFDFKLPLQNKDLYSIFLDLQSIKGDFSCTVQFKPSHGTDFVDWGTFKHLAPWRNCDIPMNCLINGFAAHNFKNLTMGEPVRFRDCDPVSKFVYGNCRKVQLKFIIEGIFWELQAYVLNAKPTPQNQSITFCDKITNDSVAICAGCEDNLTNWDIGPFESCQSLKT